MLQPPHPGESGLDYLQRIYHPGEDGPSIAPIADLVGMSAIAVEPGAVRFRLEPRPEHRNPLGTVHAGVAATLLDSVLGSAVHTCLDPDVGYTTLDLNVRFVRAITMDTGPVIAEGRAVHVGGRAATAEGRIVGEDGKLYTLGSCTCIILRPT